MVNFPKNRSIVRRANSGDNENHAGVGVSTKIAWGLHSGPPNIPPEQAALGVKRLEDAVTRAAELATDLMRQGHNKLAQTVLRNATAGITAVLRGEAPKVPAEPAPESNSPIMGG